MLRETYLEGQSELMVASIGTSKNIEELEKIKKNYPLRIYLKIEPLFDYISRNKLTDDYNNKLILSITQNINIYININNDVLIMLINYVTGNKIITKLKETKSMLLLADNIPKKMLIDDPIHEKLTPTYKKVYMLRYKAMLIAYIDLLLVVFK